MVDCVVWRLKWSGIRFCAIRLERRNLRKCNESFKHGVQRGGSFPGTALTPSNAIQPALKPSASAMRGTGISSSLEQGFLKSRADGLHNARDGRACGEADGDVIGGPARARPFQFHNARGRSSLA